MKAFLCIALLGFLAIAADGQVSRTIAHLTGTDNDPGITGTVEFEDIGGGLVRVSVMVVGITANIAPSVGIHVHEYGDISSPDGLASGGHYNPFGFPHACPDTPMRHMGDLGNWDVVNGAISQTMDIDVLQLTGGNSIVGRGVVLHAGMDDCVTQPTGNSGPRLAHGVVGVQNAAGNIASAVNPPGVTRAICVMSPTAGNSVTGTAWFDIVGSDVVVTMQVMGLPGPVHGVHIHEWGDLSSPDGLSAGGHYNPLNTIHARPPSPIRHVGDLGNIQDFDPATGTGYYREVFSDLLGFGTESILGRGMIVHELMDDGCSQPTGAAGARLAACVIGVRESSRTTPEPPIQTTPQFQPVCDVPVAAPTAVSCNDDDDNDDDGNAVSGDDDDV